MTKRVWSLVIILVPSRQLPPLWTGRLPAVLQPLTSLRAITPLLYSTDAVSVPLLYIFVRLSVSPDSRAVLCYPLSGEQDIDTFR